MPENYLDENTAASSSRVFTPKPVAKTPSYLPEEEAFGSAKTPETNYLSESDALGEHPEKDRGALGEIGTGLKRGVIGELPKMVGQATKWASDKGSDTYNFGQGIVDSAEERLNRPGNQLNPESHNVVTNALASGAEMLAPSIAIPAAVGAGVAALPGAAVSGAVGLGVSALAGAVPMGMAQAQDTMENVQKAGGTDEAARIAGWKSGAVETGGETIGTYLGGKLLGIGGKLLSNSAKEGISGIISNATDKALWKPYAKQLFETAVGETATEVAQSYTQANIEKNAGVNVNPLEQGVAAIAPTLGMTALLAPFGLAGHFKNSQRANAVDKMLADPNAAPPEARLAVVNMLHDEATNSKVPGADAWFSGAVHDVGTGAPVRRAVSDTLTPFKPESRIANALAEGDHDPNNRAGAANIIWQHLNSQDPVLADAWQEKAQEAINTGSPLSYESFIGNEGKDSALGRIQNGTIAKVESVARDKSADVRPDMNKGYTPTADAIAKAQQATTDTSTNDLMFDFADQAEAGQANEDTKYRKAKFEKMRGQYQDEKATEQANILANRDSLQANKVIPPTSAQESASILSSGSTPAMLEAERLAAKRDDSQAAFSERDALLPRHLVGAINKMEYDLSMGDSNGTVVEGSGNNATVTGGFPSTNPTWFKHSEIKAFDKENGTQYAGNVSKRSIKNALEKVRTGQPLATKRETASWEYLQKAAEKENNNDPQLVADKAFSDLEKEGFQFDAPQKVTVGNLNPGDEVVIDKNGIPDKLVHKGYDKQGNAILKDGVTMHVDPFEQIDAIAQKTSGGAISQQERDNIAGLVGRIRNEGTVEDIAKIKSEVEPFFAQNPHLEPYREMVNGVLQDRENTIKQGAQNDTIQSSGNQEPIQGIAKTDTANDTGATKGNVSAGAVVDSASAAGHEGEGIGGKERDKAANSALTEWDRAMTMYFAQQKKNSRTKSQEGTDYFATPEPLGLKMVEWANIKPGDKILEPSAGHGAIARWFPETNDRTVIEPSNELGSRLKMVTTADLKREWFEDHHIVNKYDAIIMNPPFGSGGKTAIDHLDKATQHLRDGGRVVALIPTGPAADKKFDKWFYAEDKNGKSLRPDLQLAGMVELPSVTFERAGTTVRARIVIIDKVNEIKLQGRIQQTNRDYSSEKTIKDFFGAIEHSSIGDRVAVKQEVEESETSVSVPENSGFEIVAGKHTKEGYDIWTVKLTGERTDRDTFNDIRQLAKEKGGYWSRWGKGFIFKDEEKANEFISSASQDDVSEGPAYHGTPHRGIDKFSTDNIGTGEGNQSYGWGLYFASKKEIGEFYRENLGGAARRLLDAMWAPDNELWAAGQLFAGSAAKDVADGAKILGYKGNANALVRRAKTRLAKELKKGGQLYKVELLPKEDEYLLWDRTLSKQSDKVKKALIRAINEKSGDKERILSSEDKAAGGFIYKSLSVDMGDYKNTSDYLKSLGVRGVKYLDNTSRSLSIVDKKLQRALEKFDGDVEKAADWMMRGIYETPKEKAQIRKDFVDRLKEGYHYNYVIFDENDISITDTYYELPDGTKGKVSSSQEKTSTIKEQLQKTADSPDKEVSRLAKFLQAFIPAEKLEIPVNIDPTVRTASYNLTRNLVTLTDTNKGSQTLHEVTHGITAREMEKSPRLRRKVSNLMKITRAEVVRLGLISKANMAAIESAGGSKAFKNRFPAGTLSGVEQIAYGLLNEREFLSQAFSSKEFQDILKSIPVENKGWVKNAWDAFVEAVMRALKIPFEQHTVFSEALNVTAELAGVDLNKEGKKGVKGGYKEGGDVSELLSKEVEAFRLANDLPEIKMRKDGSHPTQIATTKSTYRKIFDKVMPDYIKNGRILDFGAGKNVGGRELGIETFEPFPEKGFSPTFKDTSDIPSDSFDGVINNAVLNVVPDDVRDAIVKEIGRVLRPGGQAYINVRGNDVFQANHTVIDKDNMEVIISGTGAYQKGFTEKELISYLQKTLGDGFFVSAPSSKFGAVSAVVAKSDDISEELSAPLPIRMTSPFAGIKDKVMSTIGQYVTPERAERLATYLWDADAAIVRVQKEIGRQPEAIDYNLLRRLTGKKVADEIKLFDRDKLTPLLKDFAKVGVKFADTDELAWAEHAPERNLQMKRVNAKRYIDSFMGSFTEAEQAKYNDMLSAVQNDFVMKKQDISQKRDGYVRIMDEMSREVRSTYDEQAAAIDDLQSVLDNRNFTQEEIDKGTPERVQKRIDNARKRLDMRRDIANKWEDVKDRLSGMTNEKSVEIIKKWKADNRYPGIKKIVDKIREINEAALDMNHAAGELTDEEYQNIKNTYKYHVPLYREDMDNGRKAATGRVGVGPLASPIKIAAGSTRNVVNVFSHVIDRYQSAINRKHKLEAGRALYDMVVSNPDEDRWSIGQPDQKPYMDNEGNIRFYEDRVLEDNEVYVKVDGKKHIITVPKDNKAMMRWMEALKREPVAIGPILKASQKFTRFLAQLNTSFSPEFIISNFARDIQTAGIHLETTAAAGLQKKVFMNIKSAIKGIYLEEREKDSGEWGKLYRSFSKNGGKIGWMQGYENVEELAKNLESELAYQEGKKPKRAKYRELGRFVEAMNVSVENGVRLSTYKALLDSGVSERKAAYAVANLTVDFTRHGTVGPFMNSLYMFANAGIQGNVRMLKALGTNKKVQKIAGGIIGVGLMANILGAYSGGDDDDGESYYDKLKRTNPDLFERNMIFMIPGTKGNYIKIPMPYGYNVLFVAGNELGSALRQPVGYSAVDGMARFGSSFMGTFNPLGSATLLQTIMPTLGDPVAQVMENKAWNGQDLMPSQNPFGLPKPDSERFWKSVNPIARFATRMINEMTGGSETKSGLIDVSPETVEMVVETLTGSLGRVVKDTISLPMSLATDGSIESHKIPFVRKVYGAKSDYVDQRVFRENHDSVEQFSEQYKHADSAEKVSMRGDDRYRLMGLTKSTDSRLRTLKKQLKKYENSGDTSNVDRIKEHIDNAYRRYNTRYNEVMS